MRSGAQRHGAGPSHAVSPRPTPSAPDPRRAETHVVNPGPAPSAPNPRCEPETHVHGWGWWVQSVGNGSTVMVTAGAGAQAVAGPALAGQMLRRRVAGVARPASVGRPDLATPTFARPHPLCISSPPSHGLTPTFACWRCLSRPGKASPTCKDGDLRCEDVANMRRWGCGVGRVRRRAETSAGCQRQQVRQHRWGCGLGRVRRRGTTSVGYAGGRVRRRPLRPRRPPT